MRCFVHQDADAVAVCRACFKGVCAPCAVPVGASVACGSACAAKAAKLDRLASTAAPNARATQRTQAAFFFILFLGTGIAAVVATDVGRWVLSIAAGLLLLGAVRFYRLSAQWRD